MRPPITVVTGRLAPLLSCGLRHLLDSEGDLRLAGSDLDDAALELVLVRHAPEVAVLDEDSVTEPTLLRRLQAARPTIGLVVLARRPTRAYADRLWAMGVSACVSRDASLAELISAIRLAPKGAKRHAAADRPTRVGRVGLLSLAARERTVLALLSLGRSNAEIALELQISVEAARTHAAHIYRKLGVYTRRQLLGLELPGRDVIESRLASAS